MRLVDNTRTPEWEYIIEALRSTQQARDEVPANLKKRTGAMHTVGDDKKAPNLADLKVAPFGLDGQTDFRLVWVCAIDLR